MLSSTLKLQILMRHTRDIRSYDHHNLYVEDGDFVCAKNSGHEFEDGSVCLKARKTNYTFYDLIYALPTIVQSLKMRFWVELLKECL